MYSSDSYWRDTSPVRDLSELDEEDLINQGKFVESVLSDINSFENSLVTDLEIDSNTNIIRELEYGVKLPSFYGDAITDWNSIPVTTVIKYGNIVKSFLLSHDEGVKNGKCYENIITEKSDRGLKYIRKVTIFSRSIGDCPVPLRYSIEIPIPRATNKPKNVSTILKQVYSDGVLRYIRTRDSVGGLPYYRIEFESISEEDNKRILEMYYLFSLKHKSLLPDSIFIPKPIYLHPSKFNKSTLQHNSGKHFCYKFPQGELFSLLSWKGTFYPCIGTSPIPGLGSKSNSNLSFLIYGCYAGGRVSVLDIVDYDNSSRDKWMYLERLKTCKKLTPLLSSVYSHKVSVISGKQITGTNYKEILKSIGEVKYGIGISPVNCPPLSTRKSSLRYIVLNSDQCVIETNNKTSLKGLLSVQHKNNGVCYSSIVNGSLIPMTRNVPYFFSRPGEYSKLAKSYYAEFVKNRSMLSRDRAPVLLMTNILPEELLKGYNIVNNVSEIVGKDLMVISDAKDRKSIYFDNFKEISKTFPFIDSFGINKSLRGICVTMYTKTNNRLIEHDIEQILNYVLAVRREPIVSSQIILSRTMNMMGGRYTLTSKDPIALMNMLGSACLGYEKLFSPYELQEMMSNKSILAAAITKLSSHTALMYSYLNLLRPVIGSNIAIVNSNKMITSSIAPDDNTVFIRLDSSNMSMTVVSRDSYKEMIDYNEGIRSLLPCISKYKEPSKRAGKYPVIDRKQIKSIKNPQISINVIKQYYRSIGSKYYPQEGKILFSIMRGLDIHVNNFLLSNDELM